MSDEIITLWRYRDLPEALIVHRKLQDEGFDCFLADAEVVRLNWYWSNAFGGVRLQVPADEAESALAVLAQEIPATFSAGDSGEEYQQPACPNCGSLDVSFRTFHRGIALAALQFINLPVLFFWNSWKCEDCGRRWKGEYV